jgi:hypothetical protein
VIPASPLEGDDAAAKWLSGADLEAEADAALRVLNVALHAHRVAVADAAVQEIAREDALVVRVGYGAGEQVAEGRWTEAKELPLPKGDRRRRTAALRPQERLAALLGGRDAALACELLVLRARTDLDAGREREAALQLRAAFEAALAELVPWQERGDLAQRLGELADLQAGVDDAARAALEHGLGSEQAQAVEHALGRLEAALRARSAAGFA